MQIDITGHHIKITDSLRGQVTRALEDINGRHQRHPVEHAHIVFEIDGGQHHCSLKVNNKNGTFVAKDGADDMYVAISRSAGKLERQMAAASAKRKRKQTR